MNAPKKDEPPAKRLEGWASLMARATSNDAATYRTHAHRLRIAELACDWEGVGAVRAALAEIAIGLEEMTDKYRRLAELGECGPAAPSGSKES